MGAPLLLQRAVTNFLLNRFVPLQKDYTAFYHTHKGSSQAIGVYRVIRVRSRKSSLHRKPSSFPPHRSFAHVKHLLESFLREERGGGLAAIAGLTNDGDGSFRVELGVPRVQLSERNQF